jgi:hypothetical protein
MYNDVTMTTMYIVVQLTLLCNVVYSTTMSNDVGMPTLCIVVNMALLCNVVILQTLYNDLILTSMYNDVLIDVHQCGFGVFATTLWLTTLYNVADCILRKKCGYSAADRRP